MKNISILKTLRIIILIAFIFQVIDFFVSKDGHNVYQIISTCLLFGGLIFAFVFSGQLEQEKIEIEGKKK